MIGRPRLQLFGLKTAVLTLVKNEKTDRPPSRAPSSMPSSKCWWRSACARWRPPASPGWWWRRRRREPQLRAALDAIEAARLRRVLSGAGALHRQRGDDRLRASQATRPSARLHREAALGSDGVASSRRGAARCRRAGARCWPCAATPGSRTSPRRTARSSGRAGTRSRQGEQRGDERGERGVAGKGDHQPGDDGAEADAPVERQQHAAAVATPLPPWKRWNTGRRCRGTRRGRPPPARR